MFVCLVEYLGKQYSMITSEFIPLSLDLDHSGLIWHPEIGDEIIPRDTLQSVAILVDPQGMTPKELRLFYLWLPNVEQLVHQIEARQAIIYHAGVTNSFSYEAVLKTGDGVIEAKGSTLRVAFGAALKNLLCNKSHEPVH